MPRPLHQDPTRALLRQKREFKEFSQRGVAPFQGTAGLFAAFDLHVALDDTLGPTKSRGRVVARLREEMTLSNHDHSAAAGYRVAPLTPPKSRSRATRSGIPESEVAGRRPRPRSAGACSSSSSSSRAFHHGNPLSLPPVALAFDEGHQWSLTAYTTHGYTPVEPPARPRWQAPRAVGPGGAAGPAGAAGAPPAAGGQPRAPAAAPPAGERGPESPPPGPAEPAAPRGWPAPRAPGEAPRGSPAAEEKRAKESFVRRRREELEEQRRRHFDEGARARLAKREREARQRAELLARTALTAAVAARAAAAMRGRVERHKLVAKSALTISRTGRAYLERCRAIFMSSLRSEKVLRRRKDAAVEVLKGVLQTSGTSRKYHRAIARVLNAAYTLQRVCRAWCWCRRARLLALVRLFRRLEPHATAEVRACIKHEQGQLLGPSSPLTPGWLSKGAADLSVLRERVLHTSNHAHTIMLEAARAEAAYRHSHPGAAAAHLSAEMGRGAGDGTRPRSRAGKRVAKGKRAKMARKAAPAGDVAAKVRLNFFERDRQEDGQVWGVCVGFLHEERMRIYSRHHQLEARLRDKVERAREADVARVAHVDYMNRQQMAEFLASSPHSVAAAAANAAEQRRLDQKMAIQQRASDLLAVPMEPLVVYTGSSRGRFENLVLESAKARLGPTMGIPDWK